MDITHHRYIGKDDTYENYVHLKLKKTKFFRSKIKYYLHLINDYYNNLKSKHFDYIILKQRIDCIKINGVNEIIFYFNTDGEIYDFEVYYKIGFF